MKKYKCIIVRSLTYAKKAEKVLSSMGINCSVVNVRAGSVSGCGRCLKVENRYVDRSLEILKAEGIMLTGEVFDAP